MAIIKPDIVCILAQRYIMRISKFVKCIDFVIDWQFKMTGEELYL